MSRYSIPTLDDDLKINDDFLLRSPRISKQLKDDIIEDRIEELEEVIENEPEEDPISDYDLEEEDVEVLVVEQDTPLNTVDVGVVNDGVQSYEEEIEKIEKEEKKQEFVQQLNKDPYEGFWSNYKGRSRESFKTHESEFYGSYQTNESDDGIEDDDIDLIDTQNEPITKELLLKLKGRLSEKIIKDIADNGKKFGLTTKYRLAHFLAQCEHESGFNIVKENLNYSATGLLRIFNNYFTKEEAKKYEKRPEKIASKVYANRMGNGEEKTGEGWKYRGRGYIQLTGKNNYTEFTEFIKNNNISNDDVVKYPKLVATKYPLLSALFWCHNRRNFWRTCDEGTSSSVQREVCKLVNGGTNGLKDRINKFKKWISILG